MCFKTACIWIKSILFQKHFIQVYMNNLNWIEQQAIVEILKYTSYAHRNSFLRNFWVIFNIKYIQ